MRRALRMAIPIAAGWTLVGLLFGLRNYANFAHAGTSISWSEAFAQSLTQAYVWAVLTPIIVWLSTRFRLERGTLAWRLPLHLVAAIVLGLAHLILFLRATSAIPWVPVYTPAAAEILQNVLVYVVIAGISHGLQIHTEAQEREIRASRLQTQLTEARLGLLQAQLQPHFLFNALHAISELMHEDVDRAETMIADVSYLLRTSLESAGVQEVRLSQELEFVERYLDVERVRFEDRLAVDINVPADLLGARVPYLALQPLVENALRHAVAKQRGPSRIEIRAQRCGHNLRVEVQDSGPGTDSAAGWDAAPTPRAGAGAGPGNGVGLSNTRARLRELYGDRQSLELERVGPGVCARLTVPLLIEATDAD